MFGHDKLQCYQLAMVLAKEMPRMIENWPAGTSYLQDQLKRALSSIILNIAEGNGRITKPDRKRFFIIARGSTNEVAAILDVAYAYQWVNETTHALFKENLLRITKILYKLT